MGWKEKQRLPSDTIIPTIRRQKVILDADLEKTEVVANCNHLSRLKFGFLTCRPTLRQARLAPRGKSNRSKLTRAGAA